MGYESSPCYFSQLHVNLQQSQITDLKFFTMVSVILENTYILPNQVFLVLHHAPRSNAYSTDPASGLGGVVFQGIPHMADDTCKQP
jgi:hypothetical protein